MSKSDEHIWPQWIREHAGELPDSRLSHAAGFSIEARDIRVTDVQTTTSGDGRREAMLALRPVDAAFAERVPGEASANWDEDNGWSLLVRHESLASRVHKGLDVVPDPEDVAAWAVVLLAHPELTPSYEDHPYRDHSAENPDFEAQLAPVHAQCVSLCPRAGRL